MTTRGYKQTERHKRRRGIYQPKSEIHKKRIGLGNTGRITTNETKIKISKNHADVREGNNPRWLGGKESYHRRQGIKTWEEYWKEKVPCGYYIHHIDRDPANNDICNLALVTSHYHAILHDRGKWIRPIAGLRGDIL